MIEKIFDTKREMFREMHQLRDRNDTIEPIGYFKQENGKYFIGFVFEDLDSPIEEKEKHRQMILKYKDVWHGHPNGNFEYDKKNRIIQKTEDGNPNKPSFPDLVQLITHPFERYIIAIPKGIIVLYKQNNPLTDFLGRYLNKVGVELPHIYPDFSTCALYSVMAKNNIQNYNSSTWIKGVNSLGLGAEFYALDEIVDKNRLSEKEIIKPSPEIIKETNQYVKSNQYKQDLQITIRKLLEE